MYIYNNYETIIYKLKYKSNIPCRISQQSYIICDVEYKLTYCSLLYFIIWF